MVRRAGLIVVAALLAACVQRDGEARQYALRGQIVALAADSGELTVKHDDIAGFMPAMTMAYRVKDAAALAGLTRGDTITATLHVRPPEAWLSDIRRTGHAALDGDSGPVPRVMNVLAPGDPVPGDVLQDAHGRARRLTDWRGQAIAVTFIYTRCPMPDFCPLIERRFAEVQAQVTADASLRDRVHLAAITFDPQHDTPEVLAAHARARGADPRVWTYLTGAPEAIERVASRFGVSIIREPGDAAAITHNLRTAIVDARGALVTIHTGSDWAPAALVAELREASARR